MDGVQIIQYGLSGITHGSVYAIVAIGFNIIYNTTGIINFAQGEFVVVGAMIAVTLSALLPLPAAILLAVAATMLLGGLVELIFIRPARTAPALRLIVITIGLSILMREGMLHVWDEKVRALPFFTGSDTSTVTLAGAHISTQALWVLGTCAVIVVALTLFFRLTITGRAMRACAVNREAAALLGIPVSALLTLSFALSAALGAAAGILVTPTQYTAYNVGVPFAISGFIAAILGGFGNPAGAFLGGIMLGVAQSAAIVTFGAGTKNIVALGIMLAFLIARPRGLLGAKTA
jgi:branched-chain amino acid transport system permease protein